MTTPPITDPTQQPIAATDPRVAKVLALIQAQRQAQPVVPTDSSPTQAPIPSQVAPVAPPQVPGMPSLVQQITQQTPPDPGTPPPVQNLPPVQGQPPQLSPPEQPQISHPGPIKSFLQNLASGLGQSLYTGGQAGLQHLGLPTDYEKQQNALRLGLQQQQQTSLEGLRQAEQGLYSGKVQQLQSQLAPTQIPNDPKYGPFAGKIVPFSASQQITQAYDSLGNKKQIADDKNAAMLARLQDVAQKSPSFQHVAGMSNGQNTFANYNPKTGEYTDLTGKVLTDFKPASKAMQGALGGFGPAFAAYHLYQSAINDNPQLLPILAPILAKMMDPSNPNAAQAFATAPSGQPQDASGNLIGLRMPGAPTGATRSRGQFAESVLPSVEQAKTEIGKIGDQLGPMQGRLNDLYTGKVGAYGPQFSGLQTSLKNVGTAWMRLHANSEAAREDFAKMLSTSNNPANLVANLNALEGQAKDYVSEGQGKPGNMGINPSPKGFLQTATGANGHTIGYNGKQWVDVKTGQAVQ